MILYVKHIDIEGPETLGCFIRECGYETLTVLMTPGADLPNRLNGIEAVISLGGPMNVYEEDKYPFLQHEHVFIQKVLEAKIPFLGLCLGSQLLAKALNAKVVRSPSEEIGWGTVKLTDDGRMDDLFQGLPSEFRVFQWHSDMWQLPHQSTLLASSDFCPHQAFKMGPNAYGLQFHIELTCQNISTWTDAYWDLSDSEKDVQAQAMIDQYVQVQSEYKQTADIIYRNFHQIIQSATRLHA